MQCQFKWVTLYILDRPLSPVHNIFSPSCTIWLHDILPDVPPHSAPHSPHKQHRGNQMRCHQDTEEVQEDRDEEGARNRGMERHP